MLAIATSVSVLADSAKLDEIVITSSRNEMTLREIGTSMTVLNREDLDAYGNVSVAEILRSQTAIGVSNSGGLGKQTSLRIRGEEGYRTKFIVDGVNISDPTGTQVQAQVEHLLSSQIERIEILRGPQGMMYGADAGGVVNIITKRYSDELLNGGASAEFGRYGTQQINAQLGGGTGGVNYSLNVSDASSKGFNSRGSDLSRDEDGYDNLTVTALAGVQATDALRFQATLRNVDSESEFDNCFNSNIGASSNDCLGDFKQSNYKVDGFFSHGEFEHNLSYAVTETDRASFADGGISFDSEGEMEEIQYSGSIDISRAIEFVYGVDWQDSVIVRDGLRNLAQEQLGAYIELQGSLAESFYYTAGFRRDDNDDFGKHNTYRLTSAYLINIGDADVIKLKASYQTGFRAPSLFEIDFNATTTQEPAASEVLQEETSEGFEIGFAYHGGSGLFAEAVYFDQEIDQEISFDLVNFSGYLQESGISSSNGVELTVEYPTSNNFTLLANLTYNDTENSDGNQRIRRPEKLANLGLRWIALDGRLNLNGNWRLAKDSVDSGQIPLDDYDIVNLTASFNVSDLVEVFARAENILDEDYVEVTGFNTAGAAFYGGVRLQF